MNSYELNAFWISFIRSNAGSSATDDTFAPAAAKRAAASRRSASSAASAGSAVHSA
jgi:hypothetical protein